MSITIHTGTRQYATVCSKPPIFFNGLANKIILRNSSDPDLSSDFWPDPDSMNMELKHCESVCVCVVVCDTHLALDESLPLQLVLVAGRAGLQHDEVPILGEEVGRLEQLVPRASSCSRVEINV